MTTSLTTSTIPEYRTEDFVYEKQPKPKVSYEGIDNYERNKGSLNLGDWAQQGKNWDSPRPVPKVKYEAQSNLEKSRGIIFFHVELSTIIKKIHFKHNRRINEIIFRRLSR